MGGEVGMVDGVATARESRLDRAKDPVKELSSGSRAIDPSLATWWVQTVPSNQRNSA
jgi:hypothetical protein